MSNVKKIPEVKVKAVIKEATIKIKVRSGYSDEFYVKSEYIKDHHCHYFYLDVVKEVRNEILNAIDLIITSDFLDGIQNKLQIEKDLLESKSLKINNQKRN